MSLALTHEQKESPPTVPNNAANERKSFDGARPDPPAAAAAPAAKEKKGGFLGFLRGSSGKERTSSPGKSAPTSAPIPAPAPTTALAAPAPAATGTAPVAGQKERPEAERPPEAIAVPDITVPDK